LHPAAVHTSALLLADSLCEAIAPVARITRYNWVGADLVRRVSPTFAKATAWQA